MPAKYRGPGCSSAVSSHRRPCTSRGRAAGSCRYKVAPSRRANPGGPSSAQACAGGGSRQSRAKNACSRRPPSTWMVLASQCLPAPGSPTSSTGTSTRLASRTCSASRRTAGTSLARCSRPNQPVQRSRTATSFSGNTGCPVVCSMATVWMRPRTPTMPFAPASGKKEMSQYRGRPSAPTAMRRKRAGLPSSTSRGGASACCTASHDPGDASRCRRQMRWWTSRAARPVSASQARLTNWICRRRFRTNTGSTLRWNRAGQRKPSPSAGAGSGLGGGSAMANGSAACQRR